MHKSPSSGVENAQNELLVCKNELNLNDCIVNCCKLSNNYFELVPHLLWTSLTQFPEGCIFVCMCAIFLFNVVPKVKNEEIGGEIGKCLLVSAPTGSFAFFHVKIFLRQ